MSNFGDKVQPAVKKGDEKCCHLYCCRRGCDVGRVSDPAPDLAGKKSHLTIG